MQQVKTRLTRWAKPGDIRALARWLWVVAMLAGGLSNPALAEVSGLEQWVGSELYRDAGLSSLTAAQQALLLAWLQESRDSAESSVPPTESLATAARPAATTPNASQQQPDPPAVASLGEEQLRAKQVTVKPAAVISQIQGPFRGWTGATQFKLTNGQVWQQRVAGRYKARLESPQVRITNTRFGYRLTVLNARGKPGRAIGVKRIF